MKGKELRLEIAQFKLGPCYCFLSVLLAACPLLLIRLQRRHQLWHNTQQLMYALVYLDVQALLSPNFLQEVNHLLKARPHCMCCPAFRADSNWGPEA